MGSRNLRPRAEAQPTGRAVSKERLGSWDGQMAVWAPLHPSRRATWPNGECGYSTRCHMLGPERQEAVLPDRALYLPTFSHFLIVNKALLSFPPQKVSILQDTRVLSHLLTYSLSPSWLLILPHPTLPMSFRGDEAEGVQMYLFDHLFIYLIICLCIYAQRTGGQHSCANLTFLGRLRPCSR